MALLRTLLTSSGFCGVVKLVRVVLELVDNPTELVGPRMASTLTGLAELVTTVTTSRDLTVGVVFLASPAIMYTVVPATVILVERD